MELKLPLVLLVKIADDGPICPGLDLLGKERPLFPNKKPGLGIIDKLLKLHRSHLPGFFEDVGCDVVG